MGRLKGHHEFRNIKRFKNLETWDDLLILRLDAPLTFINIQFFKEFIETRLTSANTPISKVIIDAGAISYLDASATQGLRDLLEYFDDQRIELLICDVKGPARDMMKRTQLDELITHEHIFLDLDTAVRYATNHEESPFKEITLQTNES